MEDISQVVVGVSGFDVVEQIVHGPTGMCVVSTEQAKKEDRPPHSSALVRLDFLGPDDMKSPSTGKRNHFRPSAAKGPAPALSNPNLTISGEQRACLHSAIITSSRDLSNFSS